MDVNMSLKMAQNNIVHRIASLMLVPGNGLHTKGTSTEVWVQRMQPNSR